MKRIKVVIYSTETKTYFQRIATVMENLQRETIWADIECEKREEEKIWITVQTLARKVKLKDFTAVKVYCKNYIEENCTVEFFQDFEITHTKYQ